MAVKQNNTEGNGAPTSGNGTTTGTGSAKSNSSVSVGGGTKAKKMNSNGGGGGGGIGGGGGGGGGPGGAGGGADGSGQPIGCSGPSNSTAAKLNSNGGGVGAAGMANNVVGGMGAGGVGGGGGSSSKNELSQILQLIDCVELKQQQWNIEDMFKVNHLIIKQLSRVQIPRHPEELKRFKEDIIKVRDYFGKASEKCVYLFYLQIVCQLITNSEETPTCAIAIIFQLFNREMIAEAVQSLLSHKIPDKNIQKTVKLLSEWLRMCNFCQNLNLWIMAILNGLQEQNKLELYCEIAMENVEHLFSLLILPVLRPKVAPIVFHMLTSINHTPQIFHKILPKFPRIVPCLKQQSISMEEYADDTKQILQRLVDITSERMLRFYGYDELYEPVEQSLKDFRPSYNYLSYGLMNKAQQQQQGLENALMLHSTNAKVGLVNLGNTCYMNSVLQALAMTKEFSREILLTESKSPLLIKMQQQIALMLYSMRYELTPSRVLNATRPPGFSAGLQQDSSEFLGYLLETLHEQELVFRKKFALTSTSTSLSSSSDIDSEPIAKTSKQMEPSDAEHKKVPEEGASALAADDHNNQTKTTETAGGGVSQSTAATTANGQANEVVANKTANTSTSSASSSSCASSTDSKSVADSPDANASTIEKTFTGKLATTYKCLTCGWKSRNIDSFRDLQLSFPEVKSDCASNYSVQDLIDYYCSPEKLDGDNKYFCEKCKKLSDAERFINVIRAPKNLILTLKHFKYDQKYHMRAKLMHKVFHDEKVSVKVCAADSLEELASVHYDLYAGVVHSGFSMDSGHYYTYASDAANKWYKFNDSVVTPSKSEELHNLTPPNTPYILFYQMGARSNETTATTADVASAGSTTTTTTTTTKVIKVEVPTPLTLDELPRELRDYVNHDNYAFNEELKSRRLKLANAAALQAKHNGARGPRDDDYGGGDDDDEDQPPSASGCGGNAMNMNFNRFVY